MDGLRKCMIIVLILLLPTLLHSEQATFANGREVVHKGSGDMSISTVPDVTITPVPLSPTVPTPYPNIGTVEGAIKNPAVKITVPDTKAVTVKDPVPGTTIRGPLLKEPSSAMQLPPAIELRIREPSSPVTIREPTLRKEPRIEDPRQGKGLGLFNDAAAVSTGNNNVSPDDIRQRALELRDSKGNSNVSQPARQVREPVPQPSATVKPGHGYTGIGTVKSEGKEYVVLRNPWGKAEPADLGSSKDEAIGDAYFLATMASLAPHYEELKSVDYTNQDKAYWIEKFKHAYRFNEIMKSYLDTIKTDGFHGTTDIDEKHDSSQEGQMFGAGDVEEVARNMSVQQLLLQTKMQQENRQFTMVSNIMKLKHDSSKSSIRNTR